MRHCVWLLGLLSLFSLATHASDWQEIKNEAKGQTVWFNAWGGDTAINRYLDWVSGEMKTHYAINLKIVRLADAADAVKRIQTEAAAGRKTGGSVDLLWVNGENFRTLKRPIYYKRAGRRLCPTGAMSTHSFRCGKIFQCLQKGLNRPGAAHN